MGARYALIFLENLFLRVLGVELLAEALVCQIGSINQKRGRLFKIVFLEPLVDPVVILLVLV